jgi:hypothetical protein
MPARQDSQLATELAQVRRVLGREPTAEEAANLEALGRRVHVLAAPAMAEAVLAGTLDPETPALRAAQAQILEEEQPDIPCGLHALALLRSGAFTVRPAELTRLNAARVKRGRRPLLAHSIADTFRAQRQ